MVVKSEELLQFVNCKILRNHEIVGEDVWVRNGILVNPEKVFFDERIKADKKINCNGALISPGFIDIQINGGFGVDFSHDVDSVEEGVSKVAYGILAHGVTSFCPTLVTSAASVYKKVLPRFKKIDGSSKGATVLGVHLEGPFINKEKRGAHNPEVIRSLDEGYQTLCEVYGSLDNVCYVTLAPEIPNAMDVIKTLVDNRIAVSLGHSVADIHIGEQAAAHGATLITHLFNAMLPFHHRDPGLVGLLASDRVPSIYYGIISDGVHTHPSALRIAHRAHPDGLVLVTDAISALGLPEGTHHLGELSIQVTHDKAYIAGTSTLCGSIASMDTCVRFFKKAASCSTVEALEAATLHPAKAIGIESKKGTLNYGADADFVFLGDDLDVWSTWISGRCVYQNKAKPIAKEEIVS